MERTWSSRLAVLGVLLLTTALRAAPAGGPGNQSESSAAGVSAEAKTPFFGSSD